MVSDGMRDAECVRRLQRGETDAFEVLVRRHEKTIFNLVYRMLGDYEEAAEVSQEVSCRPSARSVSFAATPTSPPGSTASRSIRRAPGARPSARASTACRRSTAPSR